jgi:hypothetical protein
MSNVLSQLLNKVVGINEMTRLQVIQAASGGRVDQALDALADANLSLSRNSAAFGALQIYLLHLAGRYSEANQVLDEMIGLNLSEQLAINNCPTEAEIFARWDPAAEGVSVLCTTYNHERFIDMALASFFSQISSHPFEVIVRDDASTDGTGTLLEKWEQRYPRLLKVIRLSENTYQQGQSPMLAIIPHASYPLMAMCEGDDFWVDSNKLQMQAELLQSNLTWSAITHNHFELDESTGQLKPGRPSKVSGVVPRKDLVHLNTVLWCHTLMIRQSLLSMPHYQLQDGVLGDQVMTSMLGVAGPVYFLGDLFGSVARRNLYSTYTPLKACEKQRMRINTRRFLAPLFEQLNEHKTALRLRVWCEAAEQQAIEG